MARRSKLVFGPATPAVKALPGAKRIPGTAPVPYAPPSGYKMPDPTPPVSTVGPGTPPPVAPAAKDPASDLSWQDSGYNSTIANLLSQKDQGKAALVAAGRRAVEDRDKNVGLLGESRVKQKTATTQSANKSGLFYSGTLGKNLGDVDTDFDRRTGDVNTAFARSEEDRAAQGAGLDTSFNQAQQSAAQQAIDRWINGAAATESASTPSLQAIIDALSGLNAPTVNARSR